MLDISFYDLVTDKNGFDLNKLSDEAKSKFLAFYEKPHLIKLILIKNLHQQLNLGLNNKLLLVSIIFNFYIFFYILEEIFPFLF